MLYLIAGLMLTPFSIFLWSVFLRQLHTPRKIQETLQGFCLRLSCSGGVTKTLTLPAGRISCGFSPDFDVNLADYVKTGTTRGKPPLEEFAFQLAGCRLAVTAHIKVMINGVEGKTGSLPVGGALLFKTCRITFLGEAPFTRERDVYPDAAALKRLSAGPVAISLASIIFLVSGLIGLGTSGYFSSSASQASTVPGLVEHTLYPSPEMPESVPLDPGSPETSMPTPLPSPTPTSERKPVVVPSRSAVRPEPVKPVVVLPRVPVAVPDPAPERKPIVVPSRSAVRPEPIKPVAEGPRVPPRGQDAAQPTMVPDQRTAAVPRPEQRPLPLRPSEAPPPYPVPYLVAPGTPLPDIQVDVLFIHAHPDDESIDFGTLMALSREAGLKTATVLLTDGESGIFQQDYRGSRDDILTTRVQEATRALQYLGCSLYIRLGLPNHPYNRLQDEKNLEEILQIWDKVAVTIRLAEIIHTLKPTVLVSPEGPSFAREHFEHEATGVLTLLALQHLRLSGAQLPKAHLASVDPRQKAPYSGLISFPRQQVQERQRQALLSHATQADASYFGVQTIERYQEEYYLIQYWDMAVHHSHFFGLAAKEPPPYPVKAGSSLAYDEQVHPIP